MSVSSRLHTISDEDIKSIIEQPLRLEILYYGEIRDEKVLEGFTEEQKRSILTWKPSIKSEIYYLDAAFLSISYLLTGELVGNETTYPLNFLLCERLKIGDIGWGGANFFTSKEVKKILSAIQSINPETINNRFDVDFFNKNEIYPIGYNWIEKDRYELIELLEKLVKFIKGTTQNDLGFFVVLV
jgi:Domain of unknown function (DUF1877)